MSETKHRKNRKTGLRLAALVVLMFGFGFALVPLYELVCEVTGIETLEQRRQAKNMRQDVEEAGLQAQGRSITVRFDVTVNPSLPWSVTPEIRKMEVEPGKSYRVDFQAVNRSGKAVTGQAIPSIVPWQASNYFAKMECFCFNNQTLEGNETVAMPLQFIVSPDLPPNINSLTLSYSVMKIGDHEEAERG
ncbi:MAG: cytochrome c oxidase assembly protein [Xanthomonadales bacterium]|jgi:cytochrome c oxidase assembly protein subunit 11|nr:cytochrome c oxidase assembly protein [Xanthomonadales bacterium]